MDNLRFSNAQLRKLLIPLFLEQILNFMVGLADTVMVSSVGEAAVSAVSLTDSINVLIIFMLTALASGGSIVFAQSIGAGKHEHAKKCVTQLVLIVLTVSTVIAAVCLVFRSGILNLLYSKVEPQVMQDCKIYFLITALSYPFIGIFNAFSALYRADGNSAVGLKVSVVMNIINIVGNAIGVFVLRLGVAGVAYPTLISRIAAAVIMISLSLRSDSRIHLEKSISYYRFEPRIASSILKIGIPTGIENSLFQFAKLCLSSLVASLGTSATAAWAVANNVALVEYIPSSAVGIAMVTVIGQCYGAKQYEQVRYYVRKLIKITYVFIVCIAVPLALFAKPITGIFNLSDSARQITVILILMSSAAIFVHPPAFPLAHALRAMSDVTYTMIVAIVSVWLWRFCLSYFLVQYTPWGIYGVWIAMFVDWVFRALLFIPRLRHFYKNWGI